MMKCWKRRKRERATKVEGSNYAGKNFAIPGKLPRRSFQISSGPDALIFMTTELPQKSWKQFCDRLNELYRGAVSVRLANGDGSKRDMVEDVPLRVLALRRKNECSDVVTIEAGSPDERPWQYQIVEPIRIVLWQDGESGRYNHVEILAEAGTTEIDFHPGITSGMLEQLAA